MEDPPLPGNRTWQRPKRALLMIAALSLCCFYQVNQIEQLGPVPPACHDDLDGISVHAFHPPMGSGSVERAGILNGPGCLLLFFMVFITIQKMKGNTRAGLFEKWVPVGLHAPPPFQLLNGRATRIEKMGGINFLWTVPV